ncbi:FixG Ig-like domain-containing protein, partial [Saccharophagus degradans]
RDRGARLYRISNEQVQHVYTVKIHTMSHEAHEYDIQVSGEYPFRLHHYIEF